MSSGSGLIVGTQGYVVTNNSVVPACRGVLQVFDGFQISDAAIVARGATNNLAPLKLPTGKSRAVAFGCG
jgi:S1-C subfamily serine protease